MIIQLSLNNWKTTSSALLLAGGAIIHLVFMVRANTADENTWNSTYIAVIGAVGLFFAGDAGAKPPTGSYTDTTFTKNPNPPKP